MLTLSTKFRSALFVAFLAFTLGAASTAAATFTVTNTNDSGAGSFRQAILDANSAAGDDIIAFDPSFNVARTITLASIITITGNGGLTINGTGTELLTISGGNTTNIFQLSGANSAPIGAVVFNNLTLANGNSFNNSQPNGGAISINDLPGSPYTGVTFTANNIVFRNNNGGVNLGGAIGCSQSGTVNVNNSIFFGNINGTGSAIGLGACVSVVNNSTFYENGKTTGASTILYSGNGPGGLTINNSAFFNNGIDSSSAVIDVAGRVGSITNTTIANNRGGVSAVRYRVNDNTTPYSLSNVTIAGNYNSTPMSSAGLSTANINTINVRNTIIANNFSPSGGADLVDGQSSTFNSQGYNLIENVVSGTIGGSSTGNLLGIDPRLDGLMRDNGGPTRTMALRPGSPAIDAGDPTTFPVTDQRGISRPQDGDGTGGARADTGAYERRSIDIVKPAPFDFDGDGKTDIAIFRPAPTGGEWWWQRSSDNQVPATPFGLASDVVAPGDFTGDGKLDITVWRPESGFWYILRSEDFSFYGFPFGATGDVPMTADYDGDGKDDPTVFRASAGLWFITRSSDNQVATIQFGLPGDVPVAADYDGDGKADVAIRRNGPNGAEWWINRTTQGVIALIFGASTDRAVPGDYTGDGKADVAYFRPATGFWFVLRSEDFSFFGFPFGSNGDQPVSGDYDGDGRIDPAVFRPSTNTWFIAGSTSGTQIQNFGLPGDRPIPNAFVR